MPAVPAVNREEGTVGARVNPEKCTGCGACVAVCPVEAIRLVNDIAVIDEEECVDCGACVTECPQDAITF